MKPIRFTNLANDRRINVALARAAWRVIRSGVYLNGRETRAFESEFVAKYFPGFDGVAVGNGFDALQILLRVHEIKSVIVPTLSPLPVWMAATAAGAEIIPADPSSTRYVLTPNDLPMIPYVEAIIVVHLFGHPADVQGIREKALKIYGKVPFIIEDCCQAHGSKFGGSYCGSFGDAAAFSFYPTKNIGGLGDGGMIVTSDSVLASRCREIAAYGGGIRAGINSRMDEIQAAFLRTKLPYLTAWNRKRYENAQRYLHRLRKLNSEYFIRLPEDNPGHSWHQFVISTKRRDALIRHLDDNGVETAVHYWAHAPNVSFYNQATFTSIRMSNTSLSLPIGPHVSIADVNYVCDLIEKFCEGVKNREG